MTDEIFLPIAHLQETLWGLFIGKGQTTVERTTVVYMVLDE